MLYTFAFLVGKEGRNDLKKLSPLRDPHYGEDV